MSRKHYEALAAAIRDTCRAVDGDEGALHGILATTYAIAAVCAEDNPRFDRSRFLAAALPEVPE